MDPGINRIVPINNLKPDRENGKRSIIRTNSALGLSGFSAALENRTDQSPQNETYTVAQSTSVSKIPRLHSRCVRSDFRNDRSLRQSSRNLIRSVKREWRRFSEIENRKILDRHHPLNEIKVGISVGNMVGI